MSRSKRLVSLAFLSFLCSALAGQVLSQANRSSISGFVFDESKRPVGQVYVELRNEFSTVGRMRTDGSGRFYFRGLQQGRYTLRVLPMGTAYAEASEDVEISGIGVRGQQLADNVQRDIYLRPRKQNGLPASSSSVVFVQDVPKGAEALYKQAISALETKQSDAAILNLERAIQEFPEYFAALQLLGSVRVSLRLFEAAATDLTRAVRINERCFDCWFGLSYSQYSGRKFSDSITSGERAVSLKPESVEANLLLGMAYRSAKSFDKAEFNLRKAAQLSDGSSSDAHWHLALLYGRDLNRFAEAAKQLEAYLKAAPDVPNKKEIERLIIHFKEKAKTGV